MRHATACAQCRSTKRRCAPAQNASKCNQCSRRDLECSFEQLARVRSKDAVLIPSASSTPHETQSTPGAEDDPFTRYGQEAITSMVHTYIYLIHDRPHSLFHVGTLWRDLSNRTIPLPLLLSLCAFGSRLSTTLAVRLLSPELTSWAKKSLQYHLEDISLETVQACILIANICAAELDPNLEVLYFGRSITDFEDFG